MKIKELEKNIRKFYNIESTIFSVLGIACLNVNYGNIELSLDSETETFQLYRGNALQGYDIIEFSKTPISDNTEFCNSFAIIILSPIFAKLLLLTFLICAIMA